MLPVGIAYAGLLTACAGLISLLATINFVVRDTGGGWCAVRTETRVLAIDAASRRRFGVYWRMIYPEAG